jgi:AcrR family transcriptional regulator
VPRNRQVIPREQRVDELLAAATELFLSRGYAKTRMSDIAKSVGVANAALYWYFPTKEDLLAAMWNRVLDREIERVPAGGAGGDPFDRLLEGFADLRPYRQLHMTMHELLTESEVVAAAHDRLIAWVRDLVDEGLVFHGLENDADRNDVVELVVVLFEGLNVPGIRARTASEIVQLLLDKILVAYETTEG